LLSYNPRLNLHKSSRSGVAPERLVLIIDVYSPKSHSPQMRRSTCLCLSEMFSVYSWRWSVMTTAQHSIDH